MNAPIGTPNPAASGAKIAPPDDPRARAFCTPGGPEVFHAVAGRNEIWRPDPFDVETIHADARDAFQQLVGRAAMVPAPTSGRILLLLGESGSGKTHLMRAFRNHVHGGRIGYCGYMQMTSATSDYPRYVLNNLIDSLSQPYFEPHGETTGLMRLSTLLAESSPHVPSDRLARLRDEEMDAHCLAQVVDLLADLIIQDDRFNECDHDLVRALLYLQPNLPGLRGRVLKYLRCEKFSKRDGEILGGLEPRFYGDACERLIALLGQLMGSIEAAPLVLLIDQLEDIYHLDDARGRFNRAMSTVCDLAGRIPSSVVVISCLEGFYEEIKASLTTSFRSRIEEDPRPIRLSAHRELSEVVKLVSLRLEALYESHGLEIDPSDPTYPIPAAELPALLGLPTREILGWCRDFRDRCIRAGGMARAETPIPTVASTATTTDPIRLEQLWNDARSLPGEALPSDDIQLAKLLAGAIAACSDEVEDGNHFSADPDHTMIEVDCHGPGQGVDRLLVAVCNKKAQGGGLGRQIAEVEDRAGDATPVIVRSDEFATGPKAAVSRQLGELLKKGGRRVVVEDADWRAMLAMKAFRKSHGADPDFAAWAAAEKPLSRLKSLRVILDLDRVKGREIPPPPPPKSPPVVPPKPAPEPHAPAGLLEIGTTFGIRPEAVSIDPANLTTHAAFLGASGSGKTTVALSIIEQLLMQGIPAILVDRKGDLCRYADPAAWDGPLPDPAMESRRTALRSRLDVAVFTPGEPKGRPLTITAVPIGLGSLESSERSHLADCAASALCGMLNYKDTGGDFTRRVILSKAIRVLSEARPDATVTLPELIEFIDGEDPTLVHAIGKLDTKHFGKLVQDLESVQQSPRGELLSSQGEPLDAAALLGLGPHAKPGKARLSIVSTKFLGQNQDIQFWVAQFLMEMGRWISKSPAKALQAVILFDEADLYLPAMSKPPTKEPMENLLKRARSAGLGIFLATQSPGDLDYKCRDTIRTWFVGRVQQATAIHKMKPLFNDCRVDVASRLPGQGTGQFHLLREGDATAFRAHRSLIATEQLPEDQIRALARSTMA